MSGPVGMKTAKNKDTEQHKVVQQRRQRGSAGSALQQDVLSLQRAAGNQSVSQLISSSQRDWTSDTDDVTSIVDSVLESSTSRPLDWSVRSEAASALGTSLGEIHLHTDEQAGEAAQALRAEAFAVGSHIFFQPGRFAPSSVEGRQLLLHELSHTLQAGNVEPTREGPFKVSQPEDRQEVEARKVISQITVGRKPSVSRLSTGDGLTVMRQREKWAEITGSTGEASYGEPRSGTYREARATSGELGMSFAGYPIKEGYGCIVGPGGQAGHRWNEPSFDGVFFTERGRFEMDIVDNKSWAAAKDIGRTSALTGDHLLDNIDNLIREASLAKYDTVSRIGQVRDALAEVREALVSGRKIPKYVRLVVTNFGGLSTGVTTKLAEQGIIFRNLMESARRRSSIRTAIQRMARITFQSEVSRGLWRIQGRLFWPMLVLDFLDSLASMHLVEDIRKRMWRDQSALLVQIRDGLLDLNELAQAYREAGQDPFVNISMEVVWDIVESGDDQRDEYVRTELKSMSISPDPKESDQYDPNTKRIVLIERSFPFFEATEQWWSANLETTDLLEVENILSWVQRNKDNLSVIRAMPLDEKIRLLDVIFSAGISEEEAWAVYYICKSVVDGNEAKFISDTFDPKTSSISSFFWRVKVGGILSDMRRKPGEFDLKVR